MFIRGMSDTVKAKIEHFGPRTSSPGDILLTNDAYITGSHLNHMTFTVPIFHDGELVAFSCCMAHWPDVGGTLDGAHDRHLLRRPADADREDLSQGRAERGADRRSSRCNVRLPERAMGDFRAQIAAVKTGEQRFMEMIAQIRPRRRARRHRRRSWTRARRRRARASRAIPDGVYEAESFMDDDGVNVGQRVPIRVKVDGRRRPMTVDLTDVVEAGRGLLQLRRDRGPLVLPGRVQVPDLAARPADQRRPVPRARHRAAAGPRGQRAEARGDADVDDLSDDGRRHDLQGAGAGDARAGHRRPSRRSRASAASTAGGPKDDSFYIYLGGLIGGGWGAKHDSDGMNADDRDQRRRHPQRPVRAGRGEVSAAGRALCAAAGFRRRRALPRRARRRAGGAGAPSDPLQLADGPRATASRGDWTAGCPGSATRVALHRFGKTDETHFPNGKALNQVLQAGRRLHPALRRRRRLRLAARARSRQRSSATCAAATSPRRPRRNTTARCSSRIRSRSTSRPPRRAAPSMAQQGLPHDEPITEIIIPFPAARAAAGREPEHEKLTEEERVAFAMRCRCCS